MTDLQKFLKFLYQPGDIVEARYKSQEEAFPSRFWYEIGNEAEEKQFETSHVPVHQGNRRHVWLGVCPRTEKGNAAPKLARALWCDLNDTITTREQADTAVTASGLPLPSMYVFSGNGWHLYWKLQEAVPAEEIRPYSRALHAALPADATHDPSRVMRVPGTNNYKSVDDPKPSYIGELTERTYDLTDFPREDSSLSPRDTGATEVKKTFPLTPEETDKVRDAWIDGQRHELSLGLAGYLRKHRYYNEAACQAELRTIHEAAGGTWPDALLEQVVSDTYSKPIATIGSTRLLEKFGVNLDYREQLKVYIAPPARQKVPVTVHKPMIGTIDFSQKIAPQEFWIPGLVGPGLVTLWAASPKSGKSYCMMQLGFALATGEALWDFPLSTTPKRVLYFQGELSQNMVAERALQLFGNHPVLTSGQYAMTDRPEETFSLTENPEALLDLAAAFDVVIIDPISIFNSQDENSVSTVKETLSIFDSLKYQGKSVILVHHTNKDGFAATTPSFGAIRGSGHWMAAADAIALHTRIPDSNNSRVFFEFRAAPPREPMDLFAQAGGGFTSDRNQWLRESQSLNLILQAERTPGETTARISN